MLLAQINVEALLWVIAGVLWAVLLYFWYIERNRQRALDAKYPRVSLAASNTERRLGQAGLSTNLLGRIQYWAAKLFCAGLIAGIAQVVFTIRAIDASLVTLLLCAAIGFFLPDLWLMRVRRRRMRKIRAGLSFFLDLVVALLRAGLPVHRALFQAARDGFVDSHPLADEVLRIESEIQSGKDRGTAFYALADRTGVQELRTLASTLYISLKQGASIEEILAVQAEVVRERRREEAHKQVNSFASISVFPVFLCGIPIFAVVVYFPAFLEIFDTLRNLQLY